MELLDFHQILVRLAGSYDAHRQTYVDSQREREKMVIAVIGNSWSRREEERALTLALLATLSKACLVLRESVNVLCVVWSQRSYTYYGIWYTGDEVQHINSTGTMISRKEQCYISGSLLVHILDHHILWSDLVIDQLGYQSQYINISNTNRLLDT